MGNILPVVLVLAVIVLIIFALYYWPSAEEQEETVAPASERDLLTHRVEPVIQPATIQEAMATIPLPQTRDFRRLLRAIPGGNEEFRLFYPLRIGPYILSIQAGSNISMGSPKGIFDDLTRYNTWEVALFSADNSGCLNPRHLSDLTAFEWAEEWEKNAELAAYVFTEDVQQIVNDLEALNQAVAEITAGNARVAPPVLTGEVMTDGVDEGLGIDMIEALLFGLSQIHPMGPPIFVDEAMYTPAYNAQPVIEGEIIEQPVAAPALQEYQAPAEVYTPPPAPEPTYHAPVETPSYSAPSESCSSPSYDNSPSYSGE
jgi:hypothetical protein